MKKWRLSSPDDGALFLPFDIPTQGYPPIVDMPSLQGIYDYPGSDFQQLIYLVRMVVKLLCQLN
jgi:hypothetical protein